MNEKPSTLPDPEIPTITPDTCVKRPKMYVEIAYLEKNSIGEAVRQKMSNTDVYKTDMHKIYNLIASQKNWKLH